MRYVASRAVCFLLPLLVLFANPCRAQNTIAVNESQIRIQITPNATVARLPVSNSSGQPIAARATLELLDPHGVVQSQSARDVALSRGLTKLEFSLPPTPEQKKTSGLPDILWYRLRYSIVPNAPIRAPAGSGTPARPAEGIISVGVATPDIFELHVAGPAFVKESGHYLARVRAIQPVTGHPVAGVVIDASLDLDAEDGKPLLPRPAITNRSGFATIEFTLPSQVDTDEIDATFFGRLGGFATSAAGEFQVNHFSYVTLSTDKPIYQPGQTLHARVMAFDTNKKAISSELVTLKITDPDDTLVYQATAQTSAFGIASADWQIPKNLRLGTFQLQVSFGEGRYEDVGAIASVKISRYELPTFTVVPKPDRDSYLPGQDASVEIHADYLFGKPVLHGHVRLVRESNREWNYREQKWDVDEGEHWEGDSDSQGRFTAHVDLSKDHAALANADYERFHDISFAAYFTDSSTGRTEQRRFDLRLTKYPIHIYVIGANGGAPRGLPLEFYVSTDYADGAPASCDVEIEWLDPVHVDSRGSVASSSPQIVSRVRTNRYGVAKVSALALPSSASAGDFSLNFIARDRNGLVGRHTESLYFSDSPGIRVETDKTLYKLGEPISVRLATTEPGAAVIVEALHDSQVVASQLVHVRHGHADLEFAASDQFQNEVTILAYSFGFRQSQESSDSDMTGAHTVYFPKDTQLQVNVKFARSNYRPGDQAVADFHVTDPDGAHSKAALGLVVVDQAVEERARTDQNFGGRGGFYNFLNEFDDPEEIGGIRKGDLNKIDMSKPLPEDLDLVAEVLLQANLPWPASFVSENYDRDLQKVFASEINPKIQPIQEALTARYVAKGDYPKDQASLDSILAAAGIHFADVKDPWGTPYHARFSVSRERDVLEIFSAGPDKQFGTEDDFTVAQMSWDYFKPVYEALQHAIFAYHYRTGGFIRDAATLKSELAPSGFDFDTLKDPWGHLYRVSFGIDRSEFTVSVSSAGPDGRFSTDANPSNDDFPLDTIGLDYFADTRAKLDAALTDYFRRTQIFPENLDQLKKALASAGIDFDSLRDPWGHPFYATFNQEARYSDDLAVETYEQHQSAAGQHTKIVPVTQRINWVYIRSAGEDGVESTADDFTVASFSRGVVEQSSHEKTPVSIANQPVLTGATGAITGNITDPTGAIISGATISAKNSVTGETFTATSDSEGNYVVKDLPAGFYVVQISMLGFQTFSVTHVPISSSNVTHLNATLRVGAVTETVEVEAARVEVATETASVSAVPKPGTAKLSPSEIAATPHLREYFPETLLWRPEVVTDGKGFSQVKFPLADNITTWKLSAVASTQSGEIGTADRDLRAFQPFFVEHDPPPILTVGDEIALPVVLRNYLDRALQVNVELKPGSWFSLLGPGTAKSQVLSGDSSREIFRFRADSATSDGKQEVVAIGAGASDAISRSVRVHPNGEQKTVSSSEVFSGPASVDIAIPDSAISGSIETTLKIYPNLNAHVLESIEAILERPYGCGEQTISSTYPSILLLESAKSAGEEESPLVARAHRYAELGYERLLSYRSPDGGFSYWGKGDSDFALTVYAIHFLSEAREFVPVDEAVIQGAVTWVVNRIQPDGHWTGLDWTGKEDARRSVMLTAYIARMLAESELNGAASGANPQVQKVATEAVNRALAFLKPQTDAFDEPYAIASYALASYSAHDAPAFETSIARLRSLEHREGDASYWALETNTPFYGWGLAGRLETTAVVLQALAKAPDSAGDNALISRGLLFLLRNQDRYGIWYSTQATIDVLHAMQSLTSLGAENSGAAVATSKSGSKAQINVDGARALTVDLPPANALSGPIDVDLSKFVAAGKHRVEVVRPEDSPRASLQIVADYYVPWAHSTEASALHQDDKASDTLRLSVNFNAQSASVGDTIQCTVTAERIGFRGYGMLLAEIGLPPGAEVDRSTLDTLMKSSWDINEYDVLPDKLIVYLWPRAGGTTFTFDLKFRFGMKALTAASVLYDYYNPEARAVVEPVQFNVQ